MCSESEKYKWIPEKEGYEEGFKVKRSVFIEKQKVSEALEKDVFDDQAHHLLVYDKAIPVVTGRFFSDGYHFKPGRICVLKPYRGMEHSEGP